MLQKTKLAVGAVLLMCAGSSFGTGSDTGLVTFTLDSTDASQWRMFEILSAKNFPASQGVTTHWVGDSDKLSAEQLSAMCAGNWEIASHSIHHPRLSEIPLLDADAEIGPWSPVANFDKTWSFDWNNTPYEDFGWIYEDNEATRRTWSISLVQNTPGSFYLDKDTNIIYLHTRDGQAPALHDIRADSAERELGGSQSYLASLTPECAVESFFVPFHDWNDELGELSKSYYQSVATKRRPPNPIPVADPYSLVRFSLLATTPLEDVKQEILLAMSQQRWVILLIHKLGDPDTNLYKWPEEDFIALANWLAEQRIRVVTQSEGVAMTADPDEDGLGSAWDNCTEADNAAQRDTDLDGIGNACDFDLNQDCKVNLFDMDLLKNLLFTSDAHADFNGDGVVDLDDFDILSQGMSQPVGPSGIRNLCQKKHVPGQVRSVRK